jgi:hypothetical protein
MGIAWFDLLIFGTIQRDGMVGGKLLLDIIFALYYIVQRSAFKSGDNNAC